MKISILGAGAFGTALTLCFSRRHDLKITLVTIDEKHCEELRTYRENKTFLPGFEIPESIDFSTTVDRNLDLLISVGPAQEIENIAQRLAHDLDPTTPIIFCSKGIFLKDHQGYLMTEFAKQYLKNPLFVLSGPNLAKEIAMGVPSAATLAGDDVEMAKNLASRLQHRTMKLAPSDDPFGVQIVGSMKNIFAIASGVFKSLNVGINTQSAFYVQCLAEMVSVMGLYPGCKMETLHSLAGIGDLIATCSSVDSRNMSLGIALGNGESYESYQQRKHATTEGAFTANVLQKVKQHLNLPLCDFVYDIIHPKDALTVFEKANKLLTSENYLGK